MQNEWEPDFEKLLDRLSNRLREKAKSLAKSGAVDQSSYRSPLHLARILLAAAVEDAAPLVIPFPTKEELAELDNLKNF